MSALYIMIKPNWDEFKAKFPGDFQGNFEWFCYLLFCKQYEKFYGIFRYKNQIAIETEPITHQEDVIGWQAKFYETKLSENKESLLKTIQGAKETYPNITKLIIYTNKEWGQGKAKTRKSIPLTEIENEAQELNLKLQWNTESFFESPFVASENEHISRYFFSLDGGIFDFVIAKKRHVVDFLRSINCSIEFNGQTIRFSREEILNKLRTEPKKTVILSGFAGVGKTATIKSLHNSELQKSFYLFRGEEFAINNIEMLFKNCSFQNFIDFHSDENFKIVIIDSSEKLLDLKNNNPFKEFFLALRDNGWKIIFTIRSNFLQDFVSEFIENFDIKPQNLEIQNLSAEKLKTYSKEYKFKLPENEKLIELIKNPFYLNEYLKLYKDGEKLDHITFRHKLWHKIITKGRPERELCFLRIAREKADKMEFSIEPKCDSEILNGELLADGVLGYENSRYFIVHDIYEELALEQIINNEFVNNDTIDSFFSKIGTSHSIRRSFRNWISEGLLLEDDKIKSLIESVLEDDAIELLWKDSVLSSVLLSKYSNTFFEIFGEELLNNNQAMLKNVKNLLLTACNEIDVQSIKNFDFTLSNALRKPSGQGWKSFIKFVYDHYLRIGHQKLNFIIPIIFTWNKNTREGTTTQYSSLLALKYYETCMKSDSYFRSEKKDEILETIVYGSSEIKNELSEIFLQVKKNNWKLRGDKYYDLSKLILTSFNGSYFCKALPNHALEIADLFWRNISKNENSYYPASQNEQATTLFGIARIDSSYSPASSFQTPVFWLLLFSRTETIDFILEFVNKSVTFFVKSGFPKITSLGIEKTLEVKVFENNKQCQYASHWLWSTYRGFESSSYIFQSIHMALEKFLLKVGEEIEAKDLQNLLIYLLKKSISASISAVVVSIVLAYPEKTFQVAKILFKTKKFFSFDTWRMTQEKIERSTIELIVSLASDKIHSNERSQSFEEKHRQFSLENQFLLYQIRGKNSQIVERRREILWEMLDEFYSKLPNKLQETTADKEWQISLARMDLRTMEITSEKRDEGTLTSFHPKLKPRLKEFSGKPNKEILKVTKYGNLNTWVNYKIDNDVRYKKISKYEKNTNIVLKEMKEIFYHDFSNNDMGDLAMYALYKGIPPKVSSILLKDKFQELSEADRELCKDIILSISASTFDPNHSFQVGDGVDTAISTLPFILQKFPKERVKVKKILLMTLFDTRPIGESFSSCSINAILNDLWSISFDDAQSLLLGFLFFQPKYELLRKTLTYNYKLNNPESDLIKVFIDSNKIDLCDFYKNKITYMDIKSLCKLEVSALLSAFRLIPAKICSKELQTIAKNIISIFAQKINGGEIKERQSYTSGFFNKLADFVLHSKEDDIEKYLIFFLDGFTNFDALSKLFQGFISAEDKLHTYTSFWKVWLLFKRKVIEACQNKNGFYINQMIQSYLFAVTRWNNSARSWHSLKNDKKKFFKDILEEIGFLPSVLFSICKLLNGIGAVYFEYGINWIYIMLSKSASLKNEELLPDIVDYLEKFVNSYISKNLAKIKKEKSLKIQLVFILDFLVAKGSAIGYLAREKIL